MVTNASLRGLFKGNVIWGSSSNPPLTSAINNVILGNNTSTLLDNGNNNIFIGNNTGISLETGDANIFVGEEAGLLLNNGNNNIGVGSGSLSAIVNGLQNLCIGIDAGAELTSNESGNLYISNRGVNTESHTIRIGTQGNSTGQQNELFIAGAYGVTPSGMSPQMAIVDENGQFGSQAIPGGGSITWQQTTSATISALANNGYICTSTLTEQVITLPPSGSSALGDQVAVIATTGHGWRIEPDSASGTDVILFSRLNSGLLGNVESNGGYASIRLIYVGLIGPQHAWMVTECTTTVLMTGSFF